ncbi:MAG: MFS transporter [Opitutaceae bacterium]
MTSASKLPARAWQIVALLFFVGLLNYLDRVMITTMRGSLKEAIPMTDAQFGLLTSVFLWIYGVLSPFAGFLADRFSRSRVIIVSLFAWSAITWLTAHATTFNELLFARALMGISEACYIPAAFALIADYHRDRTRSLALGLHNAGIMVGSGLGGLGGLIAERHGWTLAFELFGIVGVVYGAVLIWGLRDPVPNAAPTGAIATPVHFGAALASLLSRGAFHLVLLYAALLGIAGWAVVGWMPTYFSAHFKLSQGSAGMSATGYLQAATLVGSIFTGWLADRVSRYGERQRILVPLIGLSIAAPGVLLAANTTVLPFAIAGLIIYGFTRIAADVNMMPLLCLVSDSRYRATGYGLINCCSCLIGGLTIYAGGALRDANVELDKIFSFAAGGLICCAGLLVIIRRITARTSSP